MIRDFHLLLRLEDPQLTFETFDLWRDISQSIGSLRGEVWEMLARPDGAIWYFSAYQSIDDVKSELDLAINDRVAWVLMCKNRAVYSNLSPQDVDTFRARFERPTG